MEHESSESLNETQVVYEAPSVKKDGESVFTEVVSEVYLNKIDSRLRA